MQLNRRDLQTVEMQMGPMIDMVFLLLVFFMVTAKPIKQEADIGLTLPGTVAQEEALDLPDEAQIMIQANGQVLINEMPVDSPESAELPNLFATLKRFKETSDSAQSDALVTIDVHDDVPHQRLVDVMNTCARAEITGITFADDSGDDFF
ncbi:MAG: ExbD/TolR family protein [Verrucomicrobiales bacterium]